MTNLVNHTLHSLFNIIYIMRIIIIRATHKCRNPANQKCRIPSPAISPMCLRIKGKRHEVGVFDYDESNRIKPPVYNAKNPG